MNTFPNFTYEDNLLRKGFTKIAGIDEVGRGCFAGPVVAGCVVYGDTNLFPPVKINDSKKMTRNQREKADEWIRKNALSIGIGLATATQINKYGIKKATEIAYRRAIRNCNIKIDYLLIDAFYIPHVRGITRKNQRPIIKGDSISFSIASGSIVAKVYRDNLMRRLAQNPKYSAYFWDQNKGYGTLKHRESILKHGISKHHRTKFIETWKAGL